MEIEIFFRILCLEKTSPEFKKIKQEGNLVDADSVVQKVGKGAIYNTNLKLHPSEVLNFEDFMFEQGANNLKLVNREFGNVVDILPSLDSGAWTTTTEFKPHVVNPGQNNAFIGSVGHADHIQQQHYDCLLYTSDAADEG